MLEDLHKQTFSAGDIIFSEGDAADCAYLIESGYVEVCIGSDEEQYRVSLLGSGELIGEVALVSRQKRTATVRAVSDSTLAPISRSMLDERLAKADPLIQLLLRLMLNRSRTTQEGSLPRLNNLPLNMLVDHPGPDTPETAAKQDMALAQDIAHALISNQFEMHYQPICRLADSKVVGYEALIRWEHPRLGTLPPLDFLWLAERTGQVRALGLWTLERACRDWQMLRSSIVDVEHPFISVNLSANQLTGHSLVQDVKAILLRQHMPPSELKLELTENIIIGRPEVATQILTSLIDLGGSLALDDFGTAYSGLDYLQRFPIGTIKIDRTFISQITTSSTNEEIVRSSVKLAHSLNMDVIAEGVESHAIREKLLQLNCNYGQGWLFGKAQALDQILPANSSPRTAPDQID